MKSILLATDFSDRAGPATRRAIALARAHGARLHLVHVIDENPPAWIADGQMRAAEAELDALAAAATEAGVDCAATLRKGDAHAAIAAVAAEAGAEIIVIGRHGRDPLRSAFIGTTAERMIRVGSTPVLIARAEAPADYARVVVAVNLSEEGAGHVARLQKLELCKDDRLTPVFAYEAGEFQLMRRSGATLADLKATFEAEKETVAPTVRELIGATGLDPDQAEVKPVLFNTPDTILKAAEEAHADLLVVGSRRRTTFKRYTIGSVSEACLMRAETDLLVLPPEA